VIIIHMSPHEERLLVQKAQQGDREALGLLWDALTPKLYGYLLNVTHDKNLAQDMVQTTWLRVIDKFSQFRPRHPLSAWLFAIARNECRQHWRKAKHEASFDPAAHDVPSDEYKSVENHILIDQILTRLSQEDQEILRLRYIADFSLNDIARILNLNFVTVRVRIHRALVRARSAIISQPS